MTKARTLADNYAADINQVTASAPLTGGGTSGTVTVGIQDGTTSQKGAVQLEDSTASTSTTNAATPNSVKSAYDLANGAIAKTLVDAKGDIIAATGADAVSRLAVGSANQVLTVDSSTATGLKWATPSGFAPNMTQIASGTLSGSSLTISSLSNYDFIQAVFYNINLAGSGDMAVYINNDTTSAAYWGAGFSVGGSTIGRQFRAGDTSLVQYDTMKLGANGNEFSFNFWNCKQPGFTSWSYSGTYLSNSSVRQGEVIDNGVWAVAATVSSIVFKPGATTWSGGNYRIWAA